MKYNQQGSLTCSCHTCDNSQTHFSPPRRSQEGAQPTSALSIICPMPILSLITPARRRWLTLFLGTSLYLPVSSCPLYLLFLLPPTHRSSHYAFFHIPTIIHKPRNHRQNGHSLDSSRAHRANHLWPDRARLGCIWCVLF